MDAIYWGRNFGVVIMKDSLSGDVLWFKFINRHECLEDYKEGISYLESLGYTIQGLVCDGFKGLRQAFLYYKLLLSGKNKLKALYPFTHRCCSRFTYPGAWFLVSNCKHYKMCLY